MSENRATTPDLPRRDSFIEEIAEQLLLDADKWQTAKDLALWLLQNQRQFTKSDFQPLQRVFEKIMKQSNPNLVEGDYTKKRYEDAGRAWEVLQEINGRLEPNRKGIIQ